MFSGRIILREEKEGIGGISGNLEFDGSKYANRYGFDQGKRVHEIVKRS